MTDVEDELPCKETPESMTESKTEIAATAVALNIEDEIIEESPVSLVGDDVAVTVEKEVQAQDEEDSNNQVVNDDKNVSNDDNSVDDDDDNNNDDYKDPKLVLDNREGEENTEEVPRPTIPVLADPHTHPSTIIPSANENDSSSGSGIDQVIPLDLEMTPSMASIVRSGIDADKIDTHNDTDTDTNTDTDTTDNVIPAESTLYSNTNTDTNELTPTPTEATPTTKPMEPIVTPSTSKFLQNQTTKDENDAREDEEAELAAQMAAVAVAATAATSDSESPSATANLAHTISATIAELPPPPPPPPPGPPPPPPPPVAGKDGGGGRRKKRRRYAVQVPLVRQFLIQKVVKDIEGDDDVGLGQSVEVELGQAVNIINVNQIEGDNDAGPIVVAVTAEQTGSTATTTMDGKLSQDINADAKDGMNFDSTPVDATDALVANKAEEQDTGLTSTKTNVGKIVDECQKTVSKCSQLQWQKERQERHIEQHQFKSVSTMPQLLINENNDYFLKILIMLSSFSCVPSKHDMDTTNTNTTSPSSPVSSAYSNNIHINNDSGNDNEKYTNRIWSDSENKHASDAANQILSLLEKAENSYEFLLGLLPSSTITAQSNTGYDSLNSNNCGNGMKHNTGDDNTDSDNVDNHRTNSTNSDPSIQNIEFYNDASYTVSMNQQYPLDDSNNVNDNIAEQEEDSYYGTVDIIPDLLPPCTSLNGDATAAFFHACKSKPITAPPSPTKNISEAEPVSPSKSGASNPVSPNRVPAPVPRASVTSSFVSSVLSSGGGNTLGRVISKIPGRRRGNRSNPTSPINTTSNKAAEGEGTSNRADVSSPTRQQQGPILNTSFTRRSRSGTEYDVTINREMLGLTVENVLERTVVRTVLANGAAKKAGAKVGSLIVKVGSVETTNLTHFETIDELRQSQRPLRLVLRRISKDALKGAREEMGRLIRGGGFGVATMHVVGLGAVVPWLKDKGDRDKKSERTSGSGGESIGNKGSLGKRQKISLEKDAFMMNLHEQWMDGTKRFITLSALTKKDEVLCKVGEKLIWILSLLVIGLEKEAAKLNALAEDGWANNGLDRFGSCNNSNIDSSSSTKHQHYTAKDYVDAAKSVSKILHDYVKKHFEKDSKPSFDMKQQPEYTPETKQASGIPINRKKNKLLNPPPHIMNKQMNAVPGASRRNTQQSGSSSNVFTPCSPAETALLRIGDVLHRTRMFLADPYSEPAAMLRGEVIALLCDILDIDVDMTLSEEESDLPAGGSGGGGDDGGGGLMNDLGSAGNLLKVIVLNCSMMRSPDCAEIVAQKRSLNKKQQGENDSHKAHAGNRFLAVVHRLAASRSTSARVTACSLGPVLWSHLDFPHQLQLRGVITRALHDVEVVVRKSTATVLHEIAELVFDSRAVPWLVLMCERAMTDPEPQLRGAAMTLTWHLAEHLPNAFYGDASEGSLSLRGLPLREDPTFTEVYLLQCKLLPVATRLAEDREASVRLAVAAQCDRLVNALGEHWYSVIIDLLQALLGDADDRVRSEATLCMPRLVEVVLINTANNGAGTNLSVNVLESLLPVASKLLKDKSTDVRVSLAAASGELLTLLVGLPILEETPPLGGSDLQSQSITISESVSSDRGDYSVAKGHKTHIDDALIPLLQTLLHDPDPEVTSAALRAVTNASRGNGREIGGGSQRNLGREDDSLSMSSHHSHTMDPVFTPVLSEKQVLRLLPTLSNLANSAQWRVRQSAVEIVPALLGCTHRLETRSEIAQLCITLMGDSVYSVRKTAAECLCIGGSTVGDRGTSRSREWISAIVIPHVEMCQRSSGYKQRLLSLKMVEIVLASGACPGVAGGNTENIDTTLPNPSRKMLQIAASLLDDKIANIRLNVGRVYGNVMNLLEEDDVTYVVTVLEEQLRNEWGRPEGADRDVLFYAKKAIRLAKDRLVDGDS